MSYIEFWTMLGVYSGKGVVLHHDSQGKEKKPLTIENVI